MSCFHKILIWWWRWLERQSAQERQCLLHTIHYSKEPTCGSHPCSLFFSDCQHWIRTKSLSLRMEPPGDQSSQLCTWASLVGDAGWWWVGLSGVQNKNWTEEWEITQNCHLNGVACGEGILFDLSSHNGQGI
jgi:hypothetical protein